MEKLIQEKISEWKHVAVQKSQKNTIQCVLLFVVMFSRLSHSVLTFGVIAFLNYLQMAFSVLEFLKIISHY